MKRIVFSLSVERTTYQGRYFYIGAWATEHGMLRVPGGAEPLHLLVERGGGESTRDLRFFA
jgi:fructose-1,6-bisphosphatase